MPRTHPAAVAHDPPYEHSHHPEDTESTPFGLPRKSGEIGRYQIRPAASDRRDASFNDDDSQVGVAVQDYGLHVP